MNLFIRRSSLALAALFLLTAARPVGVDSMNGSFHQQLFVLKALKPDIQKVGLFVDNAFSEDDAQMEAVRRAAAGSKVVIHIAVIGSVADVASRFRTLDSDGIDAVWVPVSSGSLAQSSSRTFLVENSARKRLPLFGPDREWVDAGAVGAFDGSLMLNQRTLTALSLRVPESLAASAQMLAVN
jgi:ABC-type uncharacterized transport system substrate-binding protein